MSRSDITLGMEEAGVRALEGWLDEENCITRSRPAVRDVFVAMTRYHRLELAADESSEDRVSTQIPHGVDCLHGCNGICCCASGAKFGIAGNIVVGQRKGLVAA